MRVSIGDVARHAGVSKTTVSRVLNDTGEAEAETARALFLAALAGVPLQAEPTVLPTSLVVRRSTVG